MKIGKKELSFIGAAVGVLALLLSVVMIYMPYQDETEILQRDIDNLNSRIVELQGWQNEMEQYEAEEKVMIADINSLIDQFPADSKEEDAILYAAKLEARNSNTSIGSIGMSAPVLLYEVGPTTIALKEDEESNDPKTFRLYNQSITYSHQFSYNGMKQFVTDIVNDNNSRTIESISLSYDRGTGILVGNTTMNLYTLSGTDKRYVKEEISGIPMGTDNVFGTLVSPTEIVTEDTETEE